MAGMYAAIRDRLTDGGRRISKTAAVIHHDRTAPQLAEPLRKLAGHDIHDRDGLPGNDPDTVWIGHIKDALFDAGGKMTPGGYGPYHVGRGPNWPTKSGGKIGGNGVWDLIKATIDSTSRMSIFPAPVTPFRET